MFKKLSRLFGKTIEMGFRTNFYAAYDQTLNRVSSKAEALETVMRIYVTRSPFNVLDDSDIKFLVIQFSQFVNCKKLLADIMWQAECYRNAVLLKDRKFIKEMVCHLVENGERLQD